MTKKTITTCDLCDKELELGLYKDHGIWSVNLDSGLMIYPELHFCSHQHMRDYMIDKCEIMEKGNDH